MERIAFPGLGLEFNIDKIAIRLPIASGGIHWYALIICTGFILAFLYVAHMERKRGHDINNILDLVLVGLPAGIIGARAYYVIFEWDRYKDNLWSVFKVWEGGLAIYGGVIAAFIAVFIVCRYKKLSVLHYLDVAAMGFMIGQAIGRWGNFVNGEAYGGACSLPWRMEIAGEPAPVHPTFLYESLWNAAGFLIIHFLTRKKTPFEGFSLCCYLIWYGIGRFFIEGMRTDSLYVFGTLRVSQLVSVFAVILGTALIIFLKKRAKKVTE